MSAKKRGWRETDTETETDSKRGGGGWLEKGERMGKGKRAEREAGKERGEK